MKTLVWVVVVAATFICSEATPLTSEKLSKSRLIRGRPWHGFVKKPPIDPRAVQSPTQYHDSKVDNLDSSNLKTYKQRYWFSDRFYKPGGPQFLMIGGRTEESSAWVDSDAVEWTVLAKELGAKLFHLEHRFYGASQPTGDLTFGSLKYLTSEQALADVKNFITSMNAAHNITNPRWITFGGSYGGALSTWARQMYPETVYAAVASSGPVQAVVDFTEYLDIVYNVLKNYDSACSDSIHNGFMKIKDLMKTDDGRKSLSKSFATCDTLASDNDTLNYFYESIIDPYMTEVQYSDDSTLFQLCQRQMTAGDDFQGVVSVVDINVIGCLDVSYQAYIDALSDTRVDGKYAEDRAWMWQTCNEFGFYISTDSSLVIRNFTGAGISIDWYIQQCAQVYDSSLGNATVYTNVQNTNNQYLGQKGYNGTKVVFPNGTNDPWHVLGVLTATNSKTYPIIIDGTSHCADMYGDNPLDPQSLIDARKKIRSHVIAWVNE